MSKVSLGDVNQPLNDANRVLEQYKLLLVQMQTVLTSYDQIEPVNTSFEMDLQDMVNDMRKKVKDLIDDIESINAIS